MSKMSEVATLSKKFQDQFVEDINSMGVSEAKGQIGYFSKGFFMYGADKTPFPEQRWAVSADQVRVGWILWQDSEVRDEKYVVIGSGEKLPPKPSDEYKDASSIIITGENGLEIDFRGSTYGFNNMVEAISTEICSRIRQGETAIFPIVTFSSDSYPNKRHGGTTYFPKANIKEWEEFKFQPASVAAVPFDDEIPWED